MVLLQLTVPFDRATNFTAAYERKKARYQYLATDIEDRGFTTLNLPLEVGVRGVITTRNRDVLTTLCGMCRVKAPQAFRKKLGKVAMLGSYQIYLARNSQQWTPGNLLRP